MYKELTVDELALIDGGKKKKKKVACTWGNAATAAASGAVKGILGGPTGALAGAIWGVSQCASNNLHGMH
ncbi:MULTISPECIES: Blp family class II bacteriocin [Lactobacillaceae]|uniref:Brevicin 174A-gamma n=1 Tax=Levilactobacillus brevis TaxID=1580 RepID=C0SQP0_LEVBR|nr:MULTISPECIES: Blp family class II bacteriocin [Lactobacillaceae]ARO02260.1 hypothetical protein BIZ31_15040 [Lactiplantibacillus plantarum]ARO05231.1 hypothetical protein BIZ32_15210 [Lactiplantibacillus plantarum]KID43083.1 plantaricin 1.25 beta [Levilactobacillus brevis]QCZ54447.1 brevicin 174A-gamma [Levilactobacillus brevis]BAH56422.1 brevicin 925A [Levilactobacillus brevis]